ncbi:hypothetical protein PA01_18870 [Azoarcus sp. PA01]|nr:hypothetical protein PA01_18870 [Azoarcus sp. PA01]
MNAPDRELRKLGAANGAPRGVGARLPLIDGIEKVTARHVTRPICRPRARWSARSCAARTRMPSCSKSTSAKR